MALLLTGIALLGAGLLVFCVERLVVLPILERLTPNIIYRVRTERLDRYLLIEAAEKADAR